VRRTGGQRKRHAIGSFSFVWIGRGVSREGRSTSAVGTKWVGVSAKEGENRSPGPLGFGANTQKRKKNSQAKGG